MQVIDKDVRNRQIRKEHADIASAMENTAGLFVSMYNFGAPTKAVSLFSDNAKLIIDSKQIRAIGASEIKASLEKLEIQKHEDLQNGSCDIHLLHSPSYYVSDDGKRARAEWDTYSYIISKNTEAYSDEVLLTRLDIWFETDYSNVKITSLDWHIMQSWKPIDYDSSQQDPLQCLYKATVPYSDMPFADAEVFKKLQSLTGSFVFTHFKGTEKLFSNDDSDVFCMRNLFEEEVRGRDIKNKFDELLKIEADNGGKYISLLLFANPVIYAEEKRAEAWFLAQSMEIKGSAYGYAAGSELLARNICQLHCKYTMTENGWKIHQFILEPLAELQTIKYDKPAFVFDRMTVQGSNFGYEEPVKDSEIGRADSCYAIENLVNAWVNGVRRGEVRFFIDSYMLPSGLTCRFDFKSRGLDAPTYETPDAIYKRTENFDKDLIIKQPAYHTASTPTIVFSKDGSHAKACWIDFGNTNMVLAFGQDASTGNIPYFASADKYMHSFDKVNGIWYMTHWYFEPMISVSRHTFLPEEGSSKGWCGSAEDGLFQAPFEDR